MSAKGPATQLRRIFLYAILIIGVIISIFPLYWMVITSLQSRGETFVLPPHLFVTQPVWRNYLEVFEKTNFATGFLNSTFVTVVKTFFTLLFSAMGGFAFAKYDFPGRNPLFVFRFRFVTKDDLLPFLYFLFS